MNGDSPDSDEWSDWLLHQRHGDDPEYERLVRISLERFANRVLDAVHLAPNMTLVDIGAGEGLIPFAAIDRVGPSLKVILTDVSAPMLHHAELKARERGVANQCAFFQCAADHLNLIADSSVDVVTTRAVLAYVSDKQAAFREFHRILKPGGHISIAEPIFQDDALETLLLKRMLDADLEKELNPFLSLMHRWKSAQFPDTEEKIAQNPIANYSERDLVRLASASGFVEIHLAFHIDISPAIFTSWNVFLDSSPHPWAPPLREILEKQFSLQERELFEATLRPTIESRQAISSERIAYLTASRPTK